jgi:hypothetical protein
MLIDILISILQVIAAVLYKLKFVSRQQTALKPLCIQCEFCALCSAILFAYTHQDKMKSITKGIKLTK